MSTKIKLRRAPSQQILHEQQLAANKLLNLSSLDGWTTEPNQPPAQALSSIADNASPAATEPSPVDPPKPAAPVVAAAPQRPWQAAPAEAVHPYHVVLSERLFQKIDWSWKRLGYRSQREFVLQALEQAANKALKELGE